MLYVHIQNKINVLDNAVFDYVRYDIIVNAGLTELYKMSDDDLFLLQPLINSRLCS